MSLAVKTHVAIINEKLNIDDFLGATEEQLDAAIIKFQEEQSSVHLS